MTKKAVKKDAKKVVAKPKEEAPPPKGIMIYQNSKNSPAVQYLGLATFTAVGQVQSLVRKVRSCELHCTTPPHPPKFNLTAFLLVKKI